MAADSNGEQTRFPCLAILRYMVATVVTVLAVVVIVMVFTVVVLRPVKISMSVVHGHVRIASNLWVVETEASSTNLAVPSAAGVKAVVGPQRGDCSGGTGGRGMLSPTRRRSCGPGGIGSSTTTVTVGGGGGYSLPPTRTTYTPAEYVDLEVILSVDNPGGRGNIYCDSMNVSFSDLPYWSSSSANTTEGKQIVWLNRTKSLVVRPQNSYKYARTLRIEDDGVLSYIASTYGGSTSFTGLLRVTMNYSSDTLVHGRTSPKIVHLSCSPVDFSFGDASATATSAQCTSLDDSDEEEDQS